jgi:hypothetical protein
MAMVHHRLVVSSGLCHYGVFFLFSSQDAGKFPAQSGRRKIFRINQDAGKFPASSRHVTCVICVMLGDGSEIILKFHLFLIVKIF